MFAVGVIFYQMIFSDFPFRSHDERAFLTDVKTKSIKNVIFQIHQNTK